MNKMPEIYPGVENDVNGGMTAVGKIIRDAWVFGLIPEEQTCNGWHQSRIMALMQEVNVEWDKYGCMVNQLPEDLFERHQRIHGEALKKARAAGWSGEYETDDE